MKISLSYLILIKKYLIIKRWNFGNNIVTHVVLSYSMLWEIKCSVFQNVVLDCIKTNKIIKSPPTPRQMSHCRIKFNAEQINILKNNMCKIRYNHQFNYT